jgi:phosphorylcholine metabolism protein LicD
MEVEQNLLNPQILIKIMLQLANYKSNIIYGETLTLQLKIKLFNSHYVPVAFFNLSLKLIQRESYFSDFQIVNTKYSVSRSVNVIKMAKSQITHSISNSVIVINNSDIVISLASEIYVFTEKH